MNIFFGTVTLRYSGVPLYHNRLICLLTVFCLLVLHNEIKHLVGIMFRNHIEGYVFNLSREKKVLKALPFVGFYLEAR